MTTEAQIQANRANAQKSTGPRTPEGKATVAQNAVTHGLLARQIVIRGEDPGEFEFYRDQMLGDLAPAGPVETALAERVVALTWRLQRAQRLQGPVFELLTEQYLPPLSPDRQEALNRLLQAQAPVLPQRSEAEQYARMAGRVLLRDFAQEGLWDRLLLHERRIEGSLYRTLAELRRLRAERRKEAAQVRQSQGQTVLPSAVAASSDSVTTSVPQTESPACETKLIGNPPPGAAGPEASAPGDMSSLLASLSGQARLMKPDHGRDAHATESPDGVTTDVPDGQGPSCETKPICAGANPRPSGYVPIFRRRR